MYLWRHNYRYISKNINSPLTVTLHLNELYYYYHGPVTELLQKLLKTFKIFCLRNVNQYIRKINYYSFTNQTYVLLDWEMTEDKQADDI